MKSSYSVLYTTVSAVSIALLMSSFGNGEARAAECNPPDGQDISTMGGINSGTISCEAIVNGGDPNNFPSAGDTLVAPVINGIADQISFTNSGTIENTADYDSPLFSTFPSSFSSSKGIGTFENSGTIGNSTKKSGNGLLLSSYYPELKLSTVPQADFFTVLQAGKTIPSTAFISVLNNTSTGQIVAVESNALYVHAGAKVTTLNNYGGIQSLGNGFNGIAVVSSTNFYSEIGVLNNFSGAIISGGVSGIFLDDRGSISTLNNSGSIYGETDYAIKMQANTDKISKIGNLNNTGSIYTLNTGADKSAIFIQGEITELSNSGRIYNAAEGYGIHITNRTIGTKIGTLTNMGEISGGKSGIYNDRGGLETLNNAQGGDGSAEFTTALTYRGILPSNYNIIINSASHYGQLEGVDTPSGTMTFGISDLSGRVTSLTYGAVLSAVDDGEIANELTGGIYRGASWRLVETGSDSDVWDLVFSSLPIYNPSLEEIVAIPLSARSASFSQQFDGSRVVMHLAESRKREKTITPTADVIYEGEQSDDTASMSQTIGATTLFSIIRGAWAEFNAVGDNPEYSTNAWGTTFGAEHRFSGLDATLGVFGSYSETDSENSSSGDNVSNIGGGIHGNKELGAGFWLDAYGAYYHHDHDITRVDGGDTYTADPDGRTWTAYGRLSYADWDFSGLAFSPYVAANYVDQALEAYDEKGSSAGALAVGEDKYWNVLTYVGSTISTDLPITQSVSVLPKLDVAWVHLMKDGERDIMTTYSVAGTGTTAATISGSDQDFARVEASLGLAIDGGLAVRVDYATELGNSDVESLHELRLEATYQF